MVLTMRVNRWTAEEVELLTKLYPNTRNDNIAKQLNRSVASVAWKASELGLKKSPEPVSKWTDSEIEQLKMLYPILPNREVALKLGRTEEAVKKKGLKLGLVKKYVRYKFWTEKEIEVLRQQYPIRSTREVARLLNRTETSVELKARRSHLRKDRGRRGSTTAIGFLGEALARQFLTENGWKIIEIGKNLGGDKGCTPYDIIAEKNGKRFAINVKYMANRLGSFAITSRNLMNLMKLNIESAFLVITPDKKFVFMPVTRL